MNVSFSKNLCFWSGHCLLNALPSFCIAGIYLEYFQSLSATLAMLTGIVVFIFAYASVFTLVPCFHDRQSRLGKALALALGLRIVLFVFGLIGLVVPILFIFHPDYYAGLVASKIQQIGYAFLFDIKILPQQMTLFFDILLWTLLEGAILTTFLMVVSAFALLFVPKAKPQSSLS